MSDQRTATEAEVQEQAPEVGEPTEARSSAGTRELRDAQRRPPIRVGDGPPAVSPVNEAPLFDESAGRALRKRWQDIQTGFVDEPRAAVEKADSLVAEVLRDLTDTFARERERLEGSWASSEGRAGDPNTEELRQAIRRYRSFFDRLLSL